MAVPPERKPDEEPLSEVEAEEAFGRLERVTRGLLRIPKEELDRHLAAKRALRNRDKHK